jgi:hypothetical protein
VCTDSWQFVVPLPCCPPERAVSAPGPDILGARVFTRGGPVEVVLESNGAAYLNQLFLFEPGPERFLASNRDVGRVVQLGSFPAGTELVFGIKVVDTGYTYKIGPAARNPDGIEHAFVQVDPDANTARVRFEDLFGGGDRSFTDTVFTFRGAFDARTFPLSVDPAISSPSVGSTATLTAELLDRATTAPVSGVSLRAAISGPNNAAVVTCVGGCLTNTLGKVVFRYQGGLAGEDRVLIFADLNGNGILNGGEPQTNAFVRWTRRDSNVVVALGDSYQSGEGAGYRLADRNSYLTRGYESGLNYPQLVGPQDQTLTGNLTRELFGSRPAAGYEAESCHRALQNYVKLDAGQLDAAKPLVLIDRTCSGATISNRSDAKPTAKPPIIGPLGGPVDPRSQLSQILRRLESSGLTPEDVDYVTVGMGGNDAKFGGIVGACVAPTLIREALRNVPNAPGEAKALAALATCGRIDGYLVKSADAIKQLQKTEEWAQSVLLTTFPNAKIYQLNYPGILPEKRNAPEYCAGVSKADIDYANKKLPQISKAIARSIHVNASKFDDRIKLVDVSTVFGINPLCPPNASDELANGFRQDKLQAAIGTLLNDQTFQPLLDKLIAAYKAERDCLKFIIGPAFGLCDSQKLADDLAASWRNVRNYMDPEGDPDDPQLKPADRLVASMAAYTSPNDSDFMLFDRSRGFFHPNDQGFRTDACALLAVHQNLPSTAGCTFVSRPAALATVNGAVVSRTPTSIAARSTVTYSASGFAPGSTVKVVVRSNPIQLATHDADANGSITGSVVLPDLEPGLHSLELDGTTESGNQIVQGTQLKILGAPRMGQTYTDYVCCFLPADDSVEATDDSVEIRVNGTLFSTEIPDADGGVTFSVPIVTDPTTVELRLNGVSPGRTVTYQNLTGCRLCVQTPTARAMALRGNAAVVVNGGISIASTNETSIRLTGSTSLTATGPAGSIVSAGPTSASGAAQISPAATRGSLPNAQATLTSLPVLTPTANCTFEPNRAQCTTPVPGAVLIPGSYRLPVGNYGTVSLVGSVQLQLDGGSIVSLNAGAASRVQLQPGTLQLEQLNLTGTAAFDGTDAYIRLGCLTPTCAGGSINIGGSSSFSLDYSAVPKNAGFAAETANQNTVALSGSATLSIAANVVAPSTTFNLSGSATVRATGREIVIGSIDAAGTSVLNVT